MIGRLSRRRSEEGSALILALFFAVIFSIFVTAVITFADVGLKSSKAFRSKRVASTGPDAAVEAAIQRRLDGAACDDENFSPRFDGGPVGGRELAVRCQNLGVSAEGSIGGVNKPRNALLALAPATDTSEGIINASPNLRVRGDVFSSSKIESNPDMVVEGRVSALGTCTGVSTDTNPSTVPLCGGDPPVADPVDGRDPDFTKSITAVPIRRPIDASALCAASGWLVRLEPGYYDDADELSKLTGGDVACDNKVVWMQPGTYYLDLGFRGGNNTWSLTDSGVNVVGGEPEGWDPLSAPRPEMPVPGSCRTTGDGTWEDGVEIIAGGQSRIDVVEGRMELCAPPRPSEQQIALYGNPTAAFKHTLEPNAVLAADGFAEPTRAFVIGEKDPSKATTGATIAPSDPDGVSLTLGQFRQTIPTGSLIHSAVLRIRHQESGDIGSGTPPSLSIPNCGPPKVLPVQASLTDNFVDLMDICGFDTPLELSELTMTYKLGGTVLGTADSSVDGVAVEVSYRVPETRKPGAAASGSGFAPPEAAFEIGERPGAVATATLAGPAPATASIALTGFADPALPPKSTIDSAVLRIAHQEGTDVTVSVAPAFNSNICTTAPTQSLQPDQIEFDLKACGLDEPADLAGISVTYTATRGAATGTSTATLDGIWLELVYPQFVGLAGTATSAEFANPSDGREIDGTATATNMSPSQTQAALSLSSWGTTLAANARIDIARLRVRHQETGTIQSAKLEAAKAGVLCAESNIAVRDTLADDFLDLETCGIDDAIDLDDLAVSYTATSTSGGRAAVDGIELQIASTGATPPATPTRRNASTVAPGTAGFLNPENAFAADGTTANAILAPLVSPTASLTLNGYNTPLLPRGSVIESAKLILLHSTTAPLGGSVSATILPTFPGSTCSTADAGNGSVPYIRDLAECGGLTAEALAGLTVKYEAQLSGAGLLPATAAVDAMVLDIEFRAPSLRPLEDCLVTSGGCALVRSAAGTGPAARFVVNGTTYAPTAKLDFTMEGLERAPFTRGVVARTINLNLGSASDNNRPLIGVPPESVLFTAYPKVAADPDSFPPQVSGGTSQPVGGFTLDPSLDEGAVLDSAMLRIGHLDDPGVIGVSITVNAACQDLEITPSAADKAETYSLDLTYCGIQTPADLEAATITYKVSGGSSELSRFSVDVYSSPLLRARVTYDLEGVTVEGWSVLT